MHAHTLYCAKLECATLNIIHLGTTHGRVEEALETHVSHRDEQLGDEAPEPAHRGTLEVG